MSLPFVIRCVSSLVSLPSLDYSASGFLLRSMPMFPVPPPIPHGCKYSHHNALALPINCQTHNTLGKRGLFGNAKQTRRCSSLPHPKGPTEHAPAEHRTRMLPREQPGAGAAAGEAATAGCDPPGNQHGGERAAGGPDPPRRLQAPPRGAAAFQADGPRRGRRTPESRSGETQQVRRRRMRRGREGRLPRGRPRRDSPPAICIALPYVPRRPPARAPRPGPGCRLPGARRRRACGPGRPRGGPRAAPRREAGAARPRPRPPAPDPARRSPARRPPPGSGLRRRAWGRRAITEGKWWAGGPAAAAVLTRAGQCG